MAARTKNTGVAESISQGAAAVTEAMVAGLFSKVRTEIEAVMHSIEERTLELEARVAKRIFGAVVMLVGVVFLIAAALLGLVQYTRVSWPAAFFICGLALLLFWWYLRYDAARPELPR